MLVTLASIQKQSTASLEGGVSGNAAHCIGACIQETLSRWFGWEPAPPPPPKAEELDIRPFLLASCREQLRSAESYAEMADIAAAYAERRRGLPPLPLSALLEGLSPLEQREIAGRLPELTSVRTWIGTGVRKISPEEDLAQLQKAAGRSGGSRKELVSQLYPRGLVEALDGEVAELPVLDVVRADLLLNCWMPKQMEYPVMRGVIDGCPFLAIRYSSSLAPGETVEVIIRREGEWLSNGCSWRVFSGKVSDAWWSRLRTLYHGGEVNGDYLSRRMISYGIRELPARDVHPDVIKELYPAELIEAIGLRRLASMPTLSIAKELSPKQYCNVIQPDDMSEPVMRIEFRGRPGVAIRFRNIATGEECVEVIHQGVLPSTWMRISYGIASPFNMADKRGLADIALLVNGERSTEKVVELP